MLSPRGCTWMLRSTETRFPRIWRMVDMQQMSVAFTPQTQFLSLQNLSKNTLPSNHCKAFHVQSPIKGVTVSQLLPHFTSKQQPSALHPVTWG